MGPNPNDIFPNPKIKTICFVKNIITKPSIIVGDYTYYSDKNDPLNFEAHVTHHYDFIGDSLIIGKFCAIGEGVEFIMNGANHYMKGITTYPFCIFDHGWEDSAPNLNDLPCKGDTVIGNDVWIGQNVTILPGVHIGDGVIIGANAVVTHDIPAYHVAGGNPCKIIRPRFDKVFIEYLLTVRWWDWNAEKIFQNLSTLSGSNIHKIKEITDL